MDPRTTPPSLNLVVTGKEWKEENTSVKKDVDGKLGLSPQPIVYSLIKVKSAKEAYRNAPDTPSNPEEALIGKVIRLVTVSSPFIWSGIGPKDRLTWVLRSDRPSLVLSSYGAPANPFASPHCSIFGSCSIASY